MADTDTKFSIVALGSCLLAKISEGGTTVDALARAIGPAKIVIAENIECAAMRQVASKGVAHPSDVRRVVTEIRDRKLRHSFLVHPQDIVVSYEGCLDHQRSISMEVIDSYALFATCRAKFGKEDVVVALASGGPGDNGDAERAIFL